MKLSPLRPPGTKGPILVDSLPHPRPPATLYPICVVLYLQVCLCYRTMSSSRSATELYEPVPLVPCLVNTFIVERKW